MTGHHAFAVLFGALPSLPMPQQNAKLLHHSANQQL